MILVRKRIAQLQFVNDDREHDAATREEHRGVLHDHQSVVLLSNEPYLLRDASVLVASFVEVVDVVLH